MRLDRLDSYLTRFQARVLSVEEDQQGQWVLLDRSAFYPTAGGQPHDEGFLGEARVVDVEARGAEVWHLVGEGPVPAIGDSVVGRIDWDRRYAHMQRHSAQHMLSQAFVRVGASRGVAADGLPGFHTRSVSMRGPDCTLDLTGDPDDAALSEAELAVNEAARRAAPVLTFEVPDSRLAQYRLRRPAKVSGLVRLVAMGDYDIVACGGTHVDNTAEVLPVKVLGSERVRGGLTRVTFRAGAEALRDHAAKHAVVQELVPRLSAPAEELPERVGALLSRVAELEYALVAARRREADALAHDLMARAEPLTTGPRLVIHALTDQDAVALFEPLVERLQNERGCVALLGVRAPQGARLAFLAGPGANVDVRPALQAALARIGGRGGGRPDRAQGAGPEAGELESALAAGAAELGARSS